MVLRDCGLHHGLIVGLPEWGPFEQASPNPCKSRQSTVTHAKPVRDFDWFAIWDAPSARPHWISPCNMNCAQGHVQLFAPQYYQSRNQSSVDSNRITTSLFKGLGKTMVG